MKITSVKVHKMENPSSRMKALATVTIDDCFVVRGLRIIEGDTKTFVAMPSRKVAPGEYKDIVNPINQETRDMFEKAILEEYEKAEPEEANVEE